MELKELSDIVGTLALQDSKVNELIGKNVRCPSLVPGTMYILKEWTIKHKLNSDNPYFVARFIGSGREDADGNRLLNKENPAINKMVDGEYYFFEAVDGKGEPYVFGAYMFQQCICIGSGAVRITCYLINGHEPPGTDLSEAPAKPRASAVRQSKPATRVAKAPIPHEDEDEDDGLGVEGAWECHPISMRPIRPANPRPAKR
jgi:hypothetical protein